MKRIVNILERFCHLLLLFAMTVSIWAYPFRIDADILDKIGARLMRSFLGPILTGSCKLIQHALYAGEAEPREFTMQHFYYTHVVDFVRLLQYTLEFKAAATGTALLLLCAAGLLYKLAAPSARRASCGESSPRIHLPLFLLVCWLIASIRWSPVKYSSFLAMILSLPFFGAFLTLTILPKPAALTRKWIDWFLIMMLPVSCISFVQHANPELMFRFIADIGIRNRISSVIGHNIALAAFCLTALYITLTRAFEPRSHWFKKTMYGAYAVFMFFLIISAQSRAIWGIGFFGCIALLYQIRKILGIRLGLRFWSILVFLLVFLALFQITNNPLNVVNRRGMTSLQQRLGDFSPKIIAEGTHVRILVCSVPLIAQRLLLGQGINSFAYAYPKAQGDYLFRYPNSILRPTEFQSAHAHNDYLQVLIELGLIGFGLTLWMVAVYFRRGLRGYAQLATPELKLQYLAIGVSLVSILAHGLIFFPLHVAHHSLLFVWLAACWTALPQDFPAQQPAAAPAPHTIPILEFARLPIIAIAAVLIARGVITLEPFYFKELQRSIFLSRSKSYLGVFRETADTGTVLPEQKNGLLNSAELWLKCAQKLDILYGPAYFDKTTLLQLKADVARKQRALAQDDGQTTEALRLYELAAINYRNAEETLMRSLGESRTHYSYHMLGLINEGRWMLTGDPAFKERARQAYTEAIRFSKGYGPSIINLSNLYFTDRPRNWNMVNYLRKMLRENSYNYWFEHFVDQIYRMLPAGEFNEALQSTEELLLAVPDDQILLQTKLSCYQRMGLLKEARQFLRAASAAHVMNEFTMYYGEMWQSLYEKNWPGVVESAEMLLERPELFDSQELVPPDIIAEERWYVEIADALALEALGDPRAHRKLEALDRGIQKQLALKLGGRGHRMQMADMYLRFFDQPEKALKIYDDEMKHGQGFSGFLIPAIRYLLQQNRREKALEYYQFLLDNHPCSLELPKFREEMAPYLPADQTESVF